jgi:arsenite methyltransferase
VAKRACAAAYSHPAVRWLLGGELHPGGTAATLRALELVDAGPGDRLLDVASGAGTSGILAARELGCRATGVEYSAAAVAEALDAARAAALGDRVAFGGRRRVAAARRSGLRRGALRVLAVHVR